MTTDSIAQPSEARTSRTWLVGGAVAGLLAGAVLAGAYAAPAWLTPGFAEDQPARVTMLVLGAAQGLGAGMLTHAVVRYRHRALPRGTGVRLFFRALGCLLLGALVAVVVQGIRGNVLELSADPGAAPFLLPHAAFGAHVGWYLGVAWHLVRAMKREEAEEDSSASLAPLRETHEPAMPERTQEGA